MDESVARESALAVNSVLDEFLKLLNSQTSTSEFENLLFGRISLADVELGYKPEAFTRYNLVEPLLQSVGLTYQPEPRSSGVHRKRWPDFKITSTGIPFIGEVKPMNDASRGVEDIKEYLGIEGFISPYGILTDGVDWHIFGPPNDGGRTSNPVERNHISLSDSLKTVALEQGYWEMDLLSSKIRANGSHSIEQFPTVFHRDRLDAWALDKMSRQYRREFLQENSSLQSSLEGIWN